MVKEKIPSGYTICYIASNTSTIKINSSIGNSTVRIATIQASALAKVNRKIMLLLSEHTKEKL